MWFLCELLLAALGYLAAVGLTPSDNLQVLRARWLQRHSRRVLRVFRTRIRSTGTVPAAGLLVSNHLSYVDILVLSAITPAAFVAKKDVQRWPVFGWFAMLAGTLFVDRERRHDVGRLNGEIKDALRHPVLLVIFPEGTSSGGQTVLPFKSSLLEPVAGCREIVTAGCISYALVDGDPAEEVCYWKDMTFAPHLFNLLSKRELDAAVSFRPVRECSPDRKELARQLHAEVLRLKPGLQPLPGAAGF